MTLAACLLMLAGGALDAWALCRAWRSPPEKGAGYRALGWAAIVATLVWPAFLLGDTRGPFIALAMVSVAALVVVASGATVRAAGRRNPGEGTGREPER